MALPAGVDGVTVSSGKPLVLPDGTPIQGKLLFSGPDVVTVAGQEVFLGGTTEAVLVNGTFSVTLAANDVAGMNPVGWTYRVTAAFSNAPGWVRFIALPKSAPSVTLAQVVVPDAAAANYVPVVGPKGDQGEVGPQGPAGPQPPLGAAGAGPTVALRSDDLTTTNARTPTAHATTHATGGSDPIAPAAIGAYPAADGQTLNVYVTDLQNRVGGEFGLETRTTAVETAVAGKADKTGGTFTGDITINGADLNILGTGKGFRFRQGGTSLDLEATGTDLLISNWSGTSFNGTQRSYMRLSADAQNVQIAGHVEFVDSLYGTTKATFDPSTGLAVTGDLDVAGRLTAAGFALPLTPPASSRPAWRDASSIVTLMQTGHGWVTSGVVGSSNLNDSSTYARGTQCATITTAGGGSGANLQRLGMSTMDLTGKAIRLLLKVDDIAHVSFLNFFVGTSSLASNFKWIVQRVTSTTSQNWIQSGEWVLVTLSWADVNAASGSYSLSSTGVPSTTSGFTDMRIQAVDDAGGTVTVHLQSVELVPDTTETFPNGVVSVTFDDSYDTVYNLARPIMENLGQRGTLYTIADALGQTGFQTLPQLKTLNTLGWEIAGHAYTRAKHDVGYNTLTGREVGDELRNLRAWMVFNGFLSTQFSYPRGFFGQTTDGANIEELTRQYFSTGRSINYESTIESFPPPMPSRMRAVSSIGSVIGSGSRAYPANLVGAGGLLDRCQLEGSWLQLTFHKIVSGTATATTECSTADFTTIMNGISSRGIPVRTVDDVIRNYK